MTPKRITPKITCRFLDPLPLQPISCKYQAKNGLLVQLDSFTWNYSFT